MNKLVNKIVSRSLQRTAVLILTGMIVLLCSGCGFGGTGRANVNTTAQNAPEGTKGVDITLDNWRTFLEMEQRVEPVYENGDVASLKISWYLKLKDACVIDNGDGTNSNDIDLAGRCELFTQTVKKAVWNEEDRTFEILEADPANADEAQINEPVDFEMTDIISGPLSEGSEMMLGGMTVEKGTYTADCETFLYAEITRIKGSVIVAG